MATSTQYNPNAELNARLIEAGASKTVYALVSSQIEAVKDYVFNGDRHMRPYLNQFRDAWTNIQDRAHEEFFDSWVSWSSPLVDFDRTLFPFYYPTAGASEALRHLIYDFAIKGGRVIHVFEGEYEGYKAMAEAAGLRVEEHPRDGKEGWHTPFGGRLNRVASRMDWGRDLFFISQPSAIDGNVWSDFNEFISKMPENSVVVDLTYVGAVPDLIGERYNMNQPAVRNVVFSLSKPFGAYYDRIGGVFCRQEDLGLFGNKWFKNLTSLAIGTKLMSRYGVFYMATFYTENQLKACRMIGEKLSLDLKPSHVYILATAEPVEGHALNDYLLRAGKLRLCLTPQMAEDIGTRGDIR